MKVWMFTCCLPWTTKAHHSWCEPVGQEASVSTPKEREKRESMAALETGRRTEVKVEVFYVTYFTKQTQTFYIAHLSRICVLSSDLTKNN